MRRLRNSKSNQIKDYFKADHCKYLSMKMLLRFLSLLYAISATAYARVTGSVTGSVTCPNLTDEELRREWSKIHKANYDDLHWSFRLIPHLMENNWDSVKSLNNEGTRTTHLYGPRRCSVRASRGVRVLLGQRGDDCPVRYVMHHDKARIPVNIVHARCVCDRCRHNKTDFSVACKPVYTETKVLRRNATCHYNWAYEMVPIACTCKSNWKVINTP